MGSSGGGGGGSGEVSWPQYLEDMHSTWLTALNTTQIPAAIALNPFSTAEAFDPASDLSIAWDAVCEFDAFVDALAYETNYASAMVKAKSVVDDTVDDTYIDADIDAFADILDNDMNVRVLPQFKAGMRDVNAVMSSAFVLGEADIYSARTREVSKYGTGLRHNLHLQRNDMIIKSMGQMLNDLTKAAELEGSVATLSVDAKRISIVAGKEEADMNLQIGEDDGRWNLEMYKYGGNMLAAASGGTSGTGGSQPSKAASALSGALSGAAIGGSVGGVPGAVVGGIIGLGAALL